MLRQRHDTLERLLASQRRDLARGDRELRARRDAAYERGVETKAYIARVMRGVTQAMEAMTADDKPVEDVGRELGEM